VGGAKCPDVNICSPRSSGLEQRRSLSGQLLVLSASAVPRILLIAASIGWFVLD
jgi:hypothetical protein